MHDLSRIRVRKQTMSLGYMTGKFLKILTLLICSILLAGTAMAAVTAGDLAESKAKREVVKIFSPEGKRLTVHQIAKSGEPDLIYSSALKYYEAERWGKSAELFDACRAYFAGSIREDSIAFFSARSKFKERDYSEATVKLEDFRRKFGRSVFLEDAEAMLAMCSYYLAPGPSRDQTVTSQAIIAFSEFNERYPNSKRVEAFKNLIEELTERLKEKSYINAYTYFKIQRYKSAVIAFRNALKQFPETHHHEDILYYISVSSYRLAHNSIESKQAERYLDMLDSYYSFIEAYPESKRCKELERYAKEAKDYLDKNNIKQ